MNERLVKIKIPLPPNDPSGGKAEWVWGDLVSEDTFVLRNVPIFAYGLSYGDKIKTEIENGVPVFKGVLEHSGHSTYRIYAKSDRNNPEVAKLLLTLECMQCDIETATSKIVGIDVLPGADIYSVYQTLADAEREGILEFEEGHCGHPLRKS